VNKEGIKLWVDALRSGQYEQGGGALRPTPGQFCCLGVACEVAIQNGINLVRVEDGYKDPDRPGSHYSGAMPEVVVKWLGLEGDERQAAGDLRMFLDPSDAESICTELAQFNDVWNLDFNKIAHIIEGNLL